jgi:large subunit ribosomal protein L31e
MAQKTPTTKIELEREYTIPLRNEWRKVAHYRRTGRAVKEIKKFIARHMKVPEHDTDKVKLDMWLNQEIWFKGRRKPPAKIRVKAIKDSTGLVRVELAELPDFVKFEKAKFERRHKPSEKSKEPEKKEEKPEEKTEEQKKDEKEKEQSVADIHALEAKQQIKAQKHLTAAKEPGFHRMALKK